MPEQLVEVVNNWDSIVRSIRYPLRMAVEICTPSVAPNGNLLLVFSDNTDYTLVQSADHIEQIEQAVEKAIKSKVTVETRLVEEGGNQEPVVDIRDVIANRLGNVLVEITS